MDDARRLAARTLALVDIPSVSRDEARIAGHVAAAMDLPGWERRHDDGEGFYWRTPRTPGRPLVLLAGHLDTVPAQDNLPGRIEGDWVVGLGASDMKGGLAVMLELARWVSEARPARAVDLGLLFFTREELPVAESPVPGIFAACPELREADLGIVMEPTDNTVQAGCLGNVMATLSFRGVAAHSARPWDGDNAIARAVAGLAPVVGVPPRPVEIDGLVYTEVLGVTRIEGGVADNVIPDRVSCRVNYRFAPDRTVADAARRLRDLVGGAGEVEITSAAPAGRVTAHTPLVARLREAGSFALAPKQAWTPVAQLTEEGVDAVNLGPGATRYAHRRDERVAVTELARTFAALQRFTVAGSAGAAGAAA
ncbi:MAG TPA: succinyl-diaminopimelate desuccinylase [Miltoncostaeaceae bacterium]|nr:succinyl-diaminopimelate desuccinylase [Miltoncostaeaceae bacterium]